MVATQQKAEGLPAHARWTCLVSGYTEAWSELLLQQGCYASKIPNKYRKPSISFEQHLLVERDCLGKRRCTVTLVVSLDSLAYINCFAILRWEVLRKQNYYLLKLKALLFLYPQIFFTSDFSFMAIATSNFFQPSRSFLYQMELPQAEDMQYLDLLIAFIYLTLF